MSDQEQLEALFRAEYDSLCDFVERFVHSSAVAEELVQLVFLRVWQRRSARPLVDVSRAYLYAAARNTAIRHLRRERIEVLWRDAKVAGEIEEPAALKADASLDEQEVAAAASRAIESLPERCRMVFTLSRQHGLRYAEIAEMLGISVGTVEVQMTRALKMLRSKLAPYLAIAFLTLR